MHVVKFRFKTDSNKVKAIKSRDLITDERMDNEFVYCREIK